MKAYKGFNRDMTCTPADGVKFQFEEGKTYEEQEAVLCKKGFHACTDPLDVFKYYSPADMCQYHEVELEDVAKGKTNDDSQVCGKKITIGAKLGIKGIVEAFVQIVLENTKKKNKASGDRAQIGSSGNGAQIGSSGYGAQIGSSGDGAKIDVDGKNSVAMCAGDGGRIKAKAGCWIALAEWEIVGDQYMPVCVKAAQVDGKTIKADTWYTLRGGEFVETEGTTL